MAIDPLWIWVAVGAAAILIVTLLFATGARRTRTANLRDKFGREYDHAVRNTGSRKLAERDLVSRAEEVNQYDIRPLNASERERFRRDWLRVEQRFVERPAAAVAEAEEVVADIMRVQGYPMGDFEKHAANLSVTHPRVIEHYRAGHVVMSRSGASTEDLRQAMLHYRALFEDLIGDRTDVASDAPRANEVSPLAPRATETRETLVDRDDLDARR
ncbi:MAG TPA: hypothetical protein VNA69_11285 [Thermoanaerobaculia bacterium]|nr:hypothetical protein [Thermoanaerobaculia bacterium]